MPYDPHLESLFNPKEVAVIGASGSPGKIGYSLIDNLLNAKFQGRIYPVNPKSTEILGLPVTNAISALPRGLDLAVITVPRQFVLPSMRELADIGCRSVVVITAGFKEVGKEGYHLEQELSELCAKHNIALIGPNCLGIMDTSTKLNATFAAGWPQKGPIAFFSQSGALCTAILDWAMGENIGFSKFVSLGNKALLDEAAMLQYMGDDEDTNVILGYVENIQDGAKFLEEAQRVSRSKPIIMIKSGTTAAGAKAASSHTGAIAGSDQAYTAAFRKSGIIRVDDVASLFNLAQAFSHQPLPKGPNLAIVTNSGGPGIMAADATEKSKLQMARISPSIIERLQAILPPYAALYNPIDIIGDANGERYRKTLEVVVEDPNVHSILVLLTPTASAEIEETAQATIDVAKTTDKPVSAVFMGKDRVAPGQKMLMDAGIPCYGFPEPAIRSLETMYMYSEWKSRPEPVFETPDRDLDAVRAVLDKAKAEGQNELVEFQAQEVLRAYKLPAPRTGLARSSEDAVAAAREIGFPVVLKIASPDISHKSDVGGVKVNLQNEAAVREAFLDITSRAQRLRPEAYIAGCLVQAMAPKGVKEIIIGVKRDDQFGPLIMFGLGGIYVEVLKDIAFRLAPMSREDARDIIREIKSFMLLKGVRGEAPVDFAALEDILLRVSQLVTDFPEIYEADFNPVLVSSEQAIVADVRMTLQWKDEPESTN